MSFLKVKDNRHLVRDVESRAIINTNDNEREIYRSKVKKTLDEKREKELLNQRINKIESDLTGINNVLNKILEKLNGNN